MRLTQLVRKAVSVVRVALCLATLEPALAQNAQHPITPEDCVGIKYASFFDNDATDYKSVILNRDNSQIGYLVKTPDILRNTNTFELHVIGLPSGSDQSDDRIVATGNIAQIRWYRDSRHISFLSKEGEKTTLQVLDIDTGKQFEPFPQFRNIEEYALNNEANVAIIAVPDTSRNEPTSYEDNNAKESGYRVATVKTLSDPLVELFASRSNGNGWNEPHELVVTDPLSRSAKRDFRIDHSLKLSLSPDGQWLLLSYFQDGIPELWHQSPFVKAYDANDVTPLITTLYNLTTTQSKLAFENITGNSNVPVWSDDSKGYVLSNQAPIGSVWEKRDAEASRISPSDENLYWVDAASSRVEEIAQDVKLYEVPLRWKEGDILVQLRDNSVGRFHQEGDAWKESERIKLPLTVHAPTPLLSDGQTIIGVYQDTLTPPDLFAFDLKKSSVRMLTKINPQLDLAGFAPVETITWQEPDGMKVDGLLFKPPSYVPGKRYPLVIHTEEISGFVCDSGSSHEPAFAPQPLATNGIMYLILTARGDYNAKEQMAQFSKQYPLAKYPGGLAEVVHVADIWDSAIDYLSSKGVVDPNKVGIIGWSRKGWYVEYLIAHARHRYAAASAADNAQYSYGERLLYGAAGIDKMYGGPPSGPTLQNWVDYSISFNFDKIHTPLLMETMGYGLYDDTPGKIPQTMMNANEVFQGVSQRAKPVEWYYYPNDVHEPEHPKARIASLQRNVDWFRFWLQGYERPNPEDPDQYTRWRHLRDLRDADMADSEKLRNAPPKT